MFEPQVIFYSDSNLGFLLHRFRRQIGVPFRLLFSNGGPCHPPFDRHDFVHQVAPCYRDEALLAGEPASKHILVPYGIHVPAVPVPNLADKHELRARLGLPPDRSLILSVGWISREHKRMDYLIQEVACLSRPRPFLQLLGVMDNQSKEILEMAADLLGRDGFAAKSVPYESVSEYYRAADCFVLASLKEGFGRVFLEALMHGLPTIGHRHKVIEYVLGDVGIVADLSQPGALTSILSAVLSQVSTTSLSDVQRHASRTRRESIRSRFSWDVLRPSYARMLRNCADGTGDRV